MDTAVDRLAKPKIFATTQWTLIRRCSQADETKAQIALEELCQSYWHPVYCCVRHRGFSVEDAEDFTQDFFAEMLARKWLRCLDEAKGRFRAYLSTALQRSLQSRRRHRLAWKRGGRCVIAPLDSAAVEQWEAQEPVTTATPEVLYDLRWARSLIAHALEQLRIELEGQNKVQLFDQFQILHTTDASRMDYALASNALNLSTGAMHGAMHRLRGRFGALLREEIARTVSSSKEVDAELQYLHQILVTHSR